MFLALTLSLAAVVACGKKDEGGGGGDKSDMKWPAKPADGTPVVFEFDSMAGTGDKMEAKVRMFNFTDKKVTRMSTTLDYLDAGGKKLKDFPWGMGGMSLLGPNEAKEETVGAFMPPETKKVEVRLRSVEFGDGSKWENPKKDE